MIVSELIAELQKYPPDQRVIVDGYEGGFDDPTVSTHQVILNEPEAYCGEHAVAYPWSANYHLRTDCVLISRNLVFTPHNKETSK